MVTPQKFMKKKTLSKGKEVNIYSKCGKLIFLAEKLAGKEIAETRHFMGILYYIRFHPNDK